ncbi:MAG: hypothetical protein IKL40_02050 [Clostridia bacterium]|nr:hypothetical protein [Clostridia bacterium]
MKKQFSKAKIVALSLTVALLLCGIIGGTIAWLVADTDPVVNTFTYGDINITLEETDTNKDGDNDPNTNNYPMIPGNPITKDPKITFLAESENAWLFVKLEKSANFDNFMTFEVADGWTALAGVDGVYYREVSKSDVDVEFYPIKDNTVTVKGEVTKEMLNNLDANGASDYPTLTVTAYAVQRDSNITTAADAWAKVPTTVNP